MKKDQELPFPLKGWFNINKRIPKSDIEDAEAQILLYAFKDGLDLKSKEVKEAINEMKSSVKQHNDKFQIK